MGTLIEQGTFYHPCIFCLTNELNAHWELDGGPPVQNHGTSFGSQARRQGRRMCLHGLFSLCDSRWKSVNSVPSCKSLIFLCGLVFVIVAVFFNFFWDEVLEYAIEKELVLSNSSKSYSLWVQNPMPLYINFYFFNWTNPTDLKQSRDKPKFEQVGPFRFREEIKKVGIKWNGNKTISYRKLRRWYFEPTGSNGSLDDVITTLNIVALTAARSTRYWNKLSRIPLSLMLSSSQNMSIRKPVREFLFEGFRDPFIEMALTIPGLSSQVPFDRFGWFYKRNDSSEFDGVFNVETGGNGLDVLGELKRWNFKNDTPFYEGPCGDVVGSAGDFWPPPDEKHDKIVLFSPDMCRYMNFAYTKEETVGGIKGFRYDSGRDLFDNGNTNPDNQCFCGGRCLPSGALNVSSCRFGAPAFVSYPHFHLADSFYLAPIEGLKPHPPSHDTFIVLDQKWGIPLEVAIRLQINILIESDSGIRMFDGVPTMLFPMIWFDQTVTVPEDMAHQIQLLLSLPRLGLIASLTFYFLGFCCFVVRLLHGRRLLTRK